jgi:hypothetical protein
VKRQISVGEAVVSGWCDARFEPLLQVFLENFTTRGEIGASLAILQGEEVVVDLYGGLCRPREDDALAAKYH